MYSRAALRINLDARGCVPPLNFKCLSPDFGHLIYSCPTPLRSCREMLLLAAQSHVALNTILVPPSARTPWLGRPTDRSAPQRGLSVARMIRRGAVLVQLLKDLGNLVEAQVSCVSTWLGCQYVAHLCTERHAFPVVNHAQKEKKCVG